MTPQADLASTRLVLTSLQEDPGQQALSAFTEQQGNPLGGRLLRGIATVAPDGKMVFGGAGLQRDDLVALAEWVKEHNEEHEALRLLADATMVRIRRDGTIEEHIEDARVWSAADVRPMPGTLEAAAARIARVAPGVEVWFWMTDRAHDGRPGLVIERPGKDPEATRMHQHLSGLRGDGAAVSGVLRRLHSGALVFSTASPLDVARSILASLMVAAPAALHELQAARLVQTGAEGLIATATAPSVANLVSTVSTIAALENPGDEAWFVYDAPEGRPILRVATTRDAVAPVRAQARNAGRDCLSGSVKRSRSGGLVFQSRSNRKGFVTELAGWVRRHHSDHPALSRMGGARFAVRSPQGELVYREKNDSAWTFLN